MLSIVGNKGRSGVSNMDPQIKTVAYTARSKVASAHAKFLANDKVAQLQMEKDRLVKALDVNKRRIHNGIKMVKARDAQKKKKMVIRALSNLTLL